MFNIFKSKKKLILDKQKSEIEKADLQSQIKDLEAKIKDLENENQDYRTGLWRDERYQELEKQIRELLPKSYEKRNLIEVLWEEKSINKRYKILKETYYEKYTRQMDYYSENFIKEIMEEILLMLDTSEKQNEIIKGELNLQVSTNYLLTKEIEELKNNQQKT